MQEGTCSHLTNLESWSSSWLERLLSKILAFSNKDGFRIHYRLAANAADGLHVPGSVPVLAEEGVLQPAHHQDVNGSLMW